MRSHQQDSVIQTVYWEQFCLKSTRSSNNLECSFFTQHSICTVSFPCGKYNVQLLYEVESIFLSIRCLIKTSKLILLSFFVVFGPEIFGQEHSCMSMTFCVAELTCVLTFGCKFTGHFVKAHLG